MKSKKLKVTFGDEIYLALSGLSVIVSLFKAPIQPVNDPALFEFFGRAMLHGQRLYLDLHDNKPPSIYLVNEVWQALFGANYFLHNCAEAAVNLASIVLFGLMLRRLRVTAWAQGTFLFALFFSLPFPQFDFTQHYAVFFIVLGLYLHFRGADFLAGVAIVVASTFWIPAALTCIPVFAQRLERRRAIAFAAGFGGVLLAGAIAVLALFNRNLVHILPAVWAHYLQFSIGYNWRNLDSTLAQSGMIPSVLFMLALLLAAVRKPVGEASRFALIWSACALAGSFIPPNFYEHYYLPSVPALAMAIASFGLTAKDFARRPIVAIIAAALLVVAVSQSMKMMRAVQADAGYVERVGTWIRSSLKNQPTVYTFEYYPDIQYASDSRIAGGGWRWNQPIPDVVVAGPVHIPDKIRRHELMQFTWGKYQKRKTLMYVPVCPLLLSYPVAIYVRAGEAAGFRCDKL
jgi:hypothetical protein